MRSIGLLCAWLVLAPPAFARSVYVSAASGSDVTGDGSQALPWRTFTHALTQANAEGDEIFAAPGIHDAALGESFPLVVPQGVTIHGAASGGDTVLRSLTAPGPTELIRAAVGTAVVPTPSTIEHLVLAGPGAATATMGVRFIAGKGQGPILRRSRISGFGRAVAVDHQIDAGPDQNFDSRPFVDGNLLHGNATAIDIRVSLVDTTGRVRERTEILNNFIWNNATGIATHAFCQGCDRSAVDLGNAILNNSIAGNSGDGLVLESSDCTGDFATNSPQVQNNVFAFQGGRGVFTDGCAVPNTVDHNVFWQNTLGGDGDPLVNVLADPLLTDVATGDLHLLSGSPGIDAGLNFIDVPDDYDSDPRPLDGDGNGSELHDIGADEYVARPALALRRANFLQRVPPLPAKSDVFPMFPSNPFTSEVTANLAPGDTDLPDFLDDGRIPLAFYQHDGSASLVLVCVKARVLNTVGFDLR